jgi:heme/copper-type cytochrome/quinol oxidase subunit 3
MTTPTHEVMHHESPATVGVRDRQGVLLLVLADAAFALSVVFSYFYLKMGNTNNGWIPEGGTSADAINGWIIVGALLVAALLFRMGYQSTVINSKGRSLAFYALSGIALLVATGLQFRQILNTPFGVAEGTYSSCYYLITYTNLIHIILTAFIVLGIANRDRIGLLDSEKHWHPLVSNIWLNWVVISAALGAICTLFV